MSEKKFELQNSLNILLLENDPADAELCLHELRRAGLNLHSEIVQTREEFCAKIESENYDVILADYNLPGWNGAEAFERLQARNRDIPFILVTGAIGDEIAVECIKRGISDYVLKDRLARLPMAIRRALQERALREERARAERMLLERERRFHALMEHSADGIALLSAKGRILFTSHSENRILGYTAKERLGENALKLIHPDDRRRASTIFQEVIGKDRNTATAHLRYLARDGSWRWLECIVTNLLNEPTVQGVVINYRDISERKRAAEEIRQLNEELERRAIERMKDEFVSVVSHELRTPLTAIRGVLGLLASGKLCQPPGNCQRMVAVGVANADRLARLVNDILDLERIQSGMISMQKKICDSADLMQQAADLMRLTAESQGVTLSVTPLSVSLWADPDRIMQVLINLLSNAIKFSPPGSAVCLSAERVGGEIRFEVKDHGRGIPAGSLTRIFERFQQVDASDSREKGGTGLGLAICRSIVTQHGGRIWAESVLGQGSMFRFVLPEQGDGVQAAEKKEAESAAQNSDH
ncbi:MAG TPA: ATP-binding protein [Terriglobia bacterium]|nr:ATP-binding protein [Terriglobia bacterium]